MNPASYDILLEMLTPSLAVNQNMANMAMNQCKSKPITADSRLAACLIILGGGRVMESMRTHGLSRTTVYSNLKKVVRAINQHPNLAIKPPQTDAELLNTAREFSTLCDVPQLFKFCVGAIDGIAIPIESPPS